VYITYPENLHAYTSEILVCLYATAWGNVRSVSYNPTRCGLPFMWVTDFYWSALGVYSVFLYTLISPYSGYWHEWRHVISTYRLFRLSLQQLVSVVQQSPVALWTVHTCRRSNWCENRRRFKVRCIGWHRTCTDSLRIWNFSDKSMYIFRVGTLQIHEICFCDDCRLYLHS